MSSAANRMRRMRERVAKNLTPLTVNVHLDRLALALGEDGFLKEWDDTERAAIEAAFAQMVEAYIVHMIGPDVTP